MKHIAIRPLSEIVSEQSQYCPGIASALAKVRKTLAVYAESRGTTFSKLRVIDVCDDTDKRKPAHALYCSIENSLLKKEAKYDAKARVSYILKRLDWGDGNGFAQNNVQSPVIPEFMKPLLPVIPRYAGGAAKYNNGGSCVTAVEKRLLLPVSEAGQRMLTVLLAVVEEHSITELDTLFLEFRPEIYKKVRELHPPNKEAATKACFTYIRRRLGYPSFKASCKSRALPLKEFPSKLREQIHKFLENAPHGFESEPVLRRKAEQKEIKIKRLERTTIKLYLDTICRCLGKIEFDNFDEIEIRSFLKIEVEQTIDEDGETYTRLNNVYVDQLREIEMSRNSDRREKGFDSEQFGTFLTAIKSVAVFNGIFHLHGLFNKAYEAITDQRSGKLRKEAKKRVFDRDWVDEEIARLGELFRKIAVKKKSFKVSENSARYSETANNLRLCLFYVKLVTLRYMGFRQQCLRNCRVGHNIVFETSGAIRFFWGVDEIKNDRELTAKLDPKKHAGSHGVLIETLNTYYKNIYPFIKGRSNKKIRGQFFVSQSDSGFKSYDRYNPSAFHQSFLSHSKLYMQFGDRLKQFPAGLHPHFFRGFCADWLVKHLGVSRAKAARLIGDSENTFVREYLDPKIGFDAADALDEASENLRIRRKTEESEVKTIPDPRDGLIDQYRIELSQKDATQAQTSENLRRALEEIDALKEELNARSEIRHREIMAAIEQNNYEQKRKDGADHDLD